MLQKLSPVSALDDAIVSARDLVRVYGKGDAQVRALDHVDIDLARGEFTAIMGPSGSGKSTLMHCLAGLDTVTSGSILIGGVEIAGLKQREITAIRRDKIGFIFQAFNLIPVMDARQNIELPAIIAGKRLNRKRVEALAAQVGLSERLRHRPTEMSGGQQQRLAVARALANNPQIIFADEPTGNLDSTATLQVLRLLRDTVDRDNHTICMVTHEAGAAAWADRVLFLRDGKIIGQLLHPSEAEIFAAMTEISGDSDEASSPSAVPGSEMPPTVPASDMTPAAQVPDMPPPPPTTPLFLPDLAPVTRPAPVTVSRRERRQRRENLPTSTRSDPNALTSPDALVVRPQPEPDPLTRTVQPQPTATSTLKVPPLEATPWSSRTPKSLVSPALETTVPHQTPRLRHAAHRASPLKVDWNFPGNSTATTPSLPPPPTDVSASPHVSGS
ncbi:ATP-binding cassette domain-containing protein [uncultured Mobiluncus sp.]|uniref:ABC transporter ATP-binding protein n=1 Tax=uncultured Mobiluncus sp. TaxID=293425 RepID=UPI002804C208|nr:ATP-binding cassette domain-containing protein [uncultured Mobiluncus sp.]